MPTAPAPALPGCGAGARLRPLFPTREVHLPSLSLLRPWSAVLPAALAGHSCPLGGPEPRRKEAGLGGGVWGEGGRGPGSCLVLVVEKKGDTLWGGCFHTQLPRWLSW